MTKGIIARYLTASWWRALGILGIVILGIIFGSARLASANAPRYCSIEGDQNNTQFGWSVNAAGDVNGDGYTDVIVGAPPCFNVEPCEGRVFVYYGSATGLEATSFWTAKSSGRFGYSVNSAGDVNGDGFADIIVGNPGVDEIVVFYGSATGLDAARLWTTKGQGGFGYSVSSAGDINGDGFDEVIVGSYSSDKVVVYYGSASGMDAAQTWIMRRPGGFGCSLSRAGDINGDGFADVIIGNPGVNEVMVYYGSTSGLDATPSWRTNGWGGFGCSVSTAGDVNGDGFADVIVSAHDSGEVFVYYGSPTGLHTDRLWTMRDFEWFGCSVGIAGDINRDGFDEVIIGAPYVDEVYVYYGGPNGLDAANILTIQGEGGFGCSVGIVEDINGDDYADVVIGAPDTDHEKGKLLVYYGGTDHMTSHLTLKR